MPATVSVWNVASEITLTAVTAIAAAARPKAAGGNVLARASRQISMAVCASEPLPAARTLASLTAARANSTAVIAGAGRAVARPRTS